MLDLDTITSRAWIRNNQEVNILGRFIYELMRYAGSHFNALAFIQGDGLAIDFDHSATAQYEEKLTGHRVKMANLPRPGRHALSDNRHLSSFYEMPAVANASPEVVFGGCAVNRLHRGLMLARF